MQTVILPGHSEKNREWADLVSVKINVEGQVRPIFWDHWLDPSQLFYPKEKATLIARHSKGEMVNIIAHSVGTLVASYIINEIPTQINKVILCGIPLHDLSEEEKTDIKKVLIIFPKENLVCYQNTNDTHATYAEIKSFVPEGVIVIEKPGSEHNYPYFEEFNKFLSTDLVT